MGIVPIWLRKNPPMLLLAITTSRTSARDACRAVSVAATAQHRPRRTINTEIRGGNSLLLMTSMRSYRVVLEEGLRSPRVIRWFLVGSASEEWLMHCSVLRAVLSYCGAHIRLRMSVVICSFITSAPPRVVTRPETTCKSLLARNPPKRVTTGRERTPKDVSELFVILTDPQYRRRGTGLLDGGLRLWCGGDWEGLYSKRVLRIVNSPE